MIAFFVSGKPKGQPRPRAYARQFGQTIRAGVYDGGGANDWKLQVAIAAKDHIPVEPLNGPLSVWLEFKMPRPKDHYGTGRNAQILKDSSPVYHTGAPDCDNLAKAVLDQLTQSRMWCDDCTVAMLRVGKCYSDRPGCHVHIGRIEDAPQPRPDAGERRGGK